MLIAGGQKPLVSLRALEEGVMDCTQQTLRLNLLLHYTDGFSYTLSALHIWELRDFND